MNIVEQFELTKYACNDCKKCKYYIDNDDTAYYECLGETEKCEEYIECKSVLRRMNNETY